MEFKTMKANQVCNVFENRNEIVTNDEIFNYHAFICETNGLVNTLLAPVYRTESYWKILTYSHLHRLPFPNREIQPFTETK